MSDKRQSFLLAKWNYKMQIFKLEIQGDIMIQLQKITQISVVNFKLILFVFQLIKNNFYIYVNILMD